jgi:hypothetical protein
MCSPAIFLDFAWEVDDDQWGSDHYPIVLRNNDPPPNEVPTKWQLKSADWEQFQNSYNEVIKYDRFQEVRDPMKLFTDLLYNIADRCISKFSANSKLKKKPWFNQDCREAIKDRKMALKNLYVHLQIAILNNIALKEPRPDI